MTNRNAFAMVTTRDSLTLTDEPSRFDFPAICALIQTAYCTGHRQLERECGASVAQETGKAQWYAEYQLRIAKVATCIWHPRNSIHE